MPVTIATGVLEFRDGQGNYQNLGCLKGDKGDPGPQGPKGDPGELPEVTSSDNGKFLRVVNGEWAVASVASATGVGF